MGVLNELGLALIAQRAIELGHSLIVEVMHLAADEIVNAHVKRIGYRSCIGKRQVTASLPITDLKELHSTEIGQLLLRDASGSPQPANVGDMHGLDPKQLIKHIVIISDLSFGIIMQFRLGFFVRDVFPEQLSVDGDVHNRLFEPLDVISRSSTGVL